MLLKPPNLTTSLRTYRHNTLRIQEAVNMTVPDSSHVLLAVDQNRWWRANHLHTLFSLGRRLKLAVIRFFNHQCVPNKLIRQYAILFQVSGSLMATILLSEAPIEVRTKLHCTMLVHASFSFIFLHLQLKL